MEYEKLLLDQRSIVRFIDAVVLEQQVDSVEKEV